MGDVPLVVLPSPYRSLTQPLQAYIQQIRQEDPLAYIHLILGSLTTASYWQQVLHRNSTIVFRIALRQFEGVAITSVPYQLHDTTHSSDLPSQVKLEVQAGESMEPPQES